MIASTIPAATLWPLVRARKDDAATGSPVPALDAATTGSLIVSPVSSDGETPASDVDETTA